MSETTKTRRVRVVKLPAESPQAIHPKYRLSELIRTRFGELNFKAGVTALAEHCGLKKAYTVNEWLHIPAGSEKEINHLVVFKVVEFFDLKNANELITPAHKKLLKTA